MTLSSNEILYVHAKRSLRIAPGHWLFDMGSRRAIGELSMVESGWELNLYDDASHPTLKSVDEVCAYVHQLRGKPVRKGSVRELPLAEDV